MQINGEARTTIELQTTPDELRELADELEEKDKVKIHVGGNHDFVLMLPFGEQTKRNKKRKVRR